MASLLLASGLPLMVHGQSPQERPLTATAEPDHSIAEPDHSAAELFALAASHYRDHQWELAIEAFEELTRQYPDDAQAPTAWFYLGESWVQRGDYRKASHCFGQHIERAGDSATSIRTRFRIAECDYLAGNRETAIAGLTGFLEQYGDDPLAEFALPYLAELQLESGDPETARQTWQQALDRFPESTMADPCRLGLARCFARLGNPPEAARLAEPVANRDNSPLADDALCLLARLWAAEGQWEKSREYANRLSSDWPDSAFFRTSQWLLARAAMADQDWKTGWSLLQPLVEQPGDPDAFSRMGLDAALVTLRLEKFEVSQDLIDRVQETASEPELLEFSAALEIDLVGRQQDLQQLEPLVDRFAEDWPDSQWLPRSLETLARQFYSGREYSHAALRYAQLIELAEAFPELQPSRPAWQYLLGLSLIGSRDFEGARARLQAIDRFEDDPEFEAATALALATALAGCEEFEAAIPRYRRYLELLPDGGDRQRCQADLARALARSGDLESAVSGLEPLVSRAPHNPAVLAACETVAEVALSEGQPEPARRWFQVLADSNHEAFARRGRTGLIWAGDQKTLEADLVSELSRQADPSMTLEALMAQAQRMQAANEHRQAARILEKIIEIDPRSGWATDARVRLAVSLLKSGKPDEQQRASELLEQFVEEHPQHPLAELALYELAWVRTESGTVPQARQTFCRIVDNYPDSRFRTDSLYRSGVLARQLQEPEQARAAFTRLIDEHPGDGLAGYAHYALGEMDMERGKLPEAIEQFETVQRDFPDAPMATPALYWMAECYYRNGQTAIAERHFRTLEQARLTNPATASGVVLRLAQCAARRDDWTTVRRMLEETGRNAPDLVQGYPFDYLRARVLMSQARFDEARQLLTDVLDDPRARHTRTAAMSQWLIGESWFHQEKYADALRAYLLVDSLYDFPEWQALALLQAAKCHWRLGNDDYATTTVERLIKTFPDSGVLVDARQLRSRIRQQSGRPQTAPAKYSKPEK